MDDQKPDPQTPISNTIRILLKEAGTNQSQLAAYLKKDPATMTDRLKGNTNITVRDLDAIAEYLGIGMGVFFFNEPDLDKWLDQGGRRKLRQRVQVELATPRSRCVSHVAQPMLPGFHPPHRRITDWVLT